MKRNSSNELRFPVMIKDGWYYVQKKYVYVYSKSNPHGGLNIPRKRLERLLKIKETEEK